MNENNKNDEILRIENLHVTYRTDEALVYAVNGLTLDLKRAAKRSGSSARRAREKPPPR